MEPEKAGFSANSAEIDVASTLQQWQSAADPRLWKLILSPEFGERLDLHRFTREVMSGMEARLRVPLEWIAVAHFNTEHPHVHVALRGLDRNGVEFKLPKEYVKSGLRGLAQHCVTAQLGHRTEQDAALAFQRQVPEQRLTPLDRVLLKRMEAGGGAESISRIVVDPSHLKGKFGIIREQALEQRVRTLSAMGLAQQAGATEWEIRRDLESVLRSMQRAADHQKTLAAHGALLSDQRLQLSAPKWKDISSLEGRVLSHGEGESGNRYLLLEGTDGRVYHLAYTPELDEARARGDLRTGAFVAIAKTVDEERKRRIEIVNLGDAEALLENREHFRGKAQWLIRRGVVVFENDSWNGWLGRYQAELRGVLANEIAAPERPSNRGQTRER